MRFYLAKKKAAENPWLDLDNKIPAHPFDNTREWSPDRHSTADEHGDDEYYRIINIWFVNPSIPGIADRQQRHVHETHVPRRDCEDCEAVWSRLSRNLL